MAKIYTVPATGHKFSEAEYHRIVTEYRSGLPMRLIAKKYAKDTRQNMRDAYAAVEYMVYRYVKLVSFWTRKPDKV